MESLDSRMPAQPYEEVIGRLNTSQRTSALSNLKVVRNIAGPGTGKTKTMECRVAHLLHTGVDPKNILALSFTNESAGEFKKRVEETCGWQGFQVIIGTFHAIANKEMRKYSKHEFITNKLGYESFFIIDTDDQNKLFSEQLNKKSKQFGTVVDAWGLQRRNFFSELSKLRAYGLTPRLFLKQRMQQSPTLKQDWESFIQKAESLPIDEVADFATNELSNNQELRNGMLTSLWSSYARTCKANHGMDFDDVLCNFFYLIKYNPDIAKKIANQYSHILIDEYQDSNFIQVAIIRELFRANPNLNLFIVGDPRQAIYGFRASDVALMVNAEKYFGDTVTYEIDTNYRSSPELLSFSNCFAEKMAGQITAGQLNPGGLHQSFNGHAIKLSVHRTDLDEAHHTINSIKDYLQKGVNPEDIYVLYRTRTGVKALEAEMKKQGIEFDMIGEMNFWEHAEVKDMSAFIRLLARPKDILAWSRCASAAKIGVRDIWLKENYHKNEGQISPLELIESRKNAKNRDSIEQFIKAVNLYQTAFSDGTDIATYTEELYPEAEVDQIKHYINTNQEYRSNFNSWRMQFIGEICDSLADYWLAQVEPEWRKTENQRNKGADSLEEVVEQKIAERTERVMTLVTNMASKLITGTSLVDIADDMMTRVTVKQKDSRKCIKFMTGHASKGLESKVVFMIANENETWYPQVDSLNLNASLEPSLDVNDELAEAQRLYYVMHTRASNHLHMSYANTRLVNGSIRNTTPLTLMTKHVDLFKQKEPHWESILDIEEYPSLNKDRPSPQRSATHSPGSFDLNQYIERSVENKDGNEAFSRIMR